MIPALIRTPLLVPDEERELARRARSGDDTARKRMVEANMRLVVSLAKRYSSSTVPYEDLVQEGAIGLLNAIDRFDPEKGYRFSTYATHWVRQCLGKALISRARVIRLPGHIVEHRRRVARFREEFEARNGRAASATEIASELHLSREKVELILSSEHDCYSLDTGKEEHWDYTASIEDETCDNPQEAAMQSADTRRLRSILAKLPADQRLAMTYRIQVGGQAASRWREVGRILEISPEAVRKLEAKAMKKIRHVLESQKDFGES